MNDDLYYKLEDVERAIYQSGPRSEITSILTLIFFIGTLNMGPIDFLRTSANFVTFNLETHKNKLHQSCMDKIGKASFQKNTNFEMIRKRMDKKHGLYISESVEFNSISDLWECHEVISNEMKIDFNSDMYFWTTVHVEYFK